MAGFVLSAIVYKRHFRCPIISPDKMEELLVFSKSKDDKTNQQIYMERIPNHIEIINTTKFLPL